MQVEEDKNVKHTYLKKPGFILTLFKLSSQNTKEDSIIRKNGKKLYCMFISVY